MLRCVLLFLGVLLLCSASTLRAEEVILLERVGADSEVSPVLQAAGCTIQMRRLSGGKQEGVELIRLDNGNLRIWLSPMRGLSILAVERKMAGGQYEKVLGWDSPVKEVVHPQYINLESRGGLGWLEGFNEWMVRCGLEYAGHPGRDEFIDNTGATSTMDLTLHGKVGNIPASLTEVVVDGDRVAIRGVVHERMFFGPKLELIAEVSTTANSSAFRIHDTVINHGAAPQEIMLLYHCNFGQPLLQQGAKVLVAADRIIPMNEHAATSIDDYATYAGPTPGYIEQVYLVHPRSDGRGETLALLKNADSSLGCSLRWSTKQLPYLTIWKNTTTLADGYVTGLEPGTCFPYNRSVERSAGRVMKLPSETPHTFAIDVAVHATTDAVAAVEKQIGELQGDKPAQLDKTPPAH